MTARSSSRKRSLDNDRIENDNNVEEETPFLDLGDEPAVALNSIKITPKQREIDKFNGLTVDAQQACVSAVARLFIFKGSKQEPIGRDNIKDVLSSIDVQYSKHIIAVVSRVQDYLFDLAGYTIVSGEYLVRKFMHEEVANKANDCVESAYQGFKSTVFFIIITTSNCQVSYEDLKRCLRRLDSRFPETLHGRHKGLTAVIPELGMDLEDLLDRMQKEHYVYVQKDEIDETKKIYHFGPRFYAEIGKKRLLLAYFHLTDQPVDVSIMQALDDEAASDADEDSS